MDTLDALEAYHLHFLSMSRDAFGRGYRLPYRLELTNGDGRVVTTGLAEAVGSMGGRPKAFELSVEDKIPREELWEATGDEIFKLPLTFALLDKAGNGLTIKFLEDELVQ